MSSRNRPPVLALALVSLLVGVFLVEAIGQSLFRAPTFAKILPHRVLEGLKRHWMAVGIGVPVQFRRDCAQADEEIFYRMKPGSCRFKSPEFDTQLSFNSLGVRDDEESLKGPEIIFLGDSVTMGWGVRRDETFEAIIEKKTGKKSLNLGVSSYGTARAFALLRRVDTSNLKTLVIQYNPNDADENIWYVLNDFSFRRNREKAWDQLADEFAAWDRKPLPFIGSLAGRRVPWEWEIPAADLDRTEALQRLIDEEKKRLPSDVKIVLFASPIDRGMPLNTLRSVSFIDVSDVDSDRDSWYVFDPHPNPRGHRRLAELVEGAL